MSNKDYCLTHKRLESFNDAVERKDHGRCVLRRQGSEPMGMSWPHDLDALVTRLDAAAYRAKRVRDWATCVDHPTDEQVDNWLDDLNRLVRETHDMLDGVYLG
jgi:hypothetical protein